MGKAERDQRHQANLDRINQVQLVAGRGDRMRIDHEGTLLERARMLGEELCAHRATELGLAALDRLVRIAEERPPAQVRDVTGFIAAIWSNKPLPLATLRGLPPEVGDDMLAVLDAFRHARLNLVEQLDGGPLRVKRVLARSSQARA